MLRVLCRHPSFVGSYVCQTKTKIRKCWIWIIPFLPIDWLTNRKMLRCLIFLWLSSYVTYAYQMLRHSPFLLKYQARYMIALSFQFNMCVDEANVSKAYNILKIVCTSSCALCVRWISLRFGFYRCALRYQKAPAFITSYLVCVLFCACTPPEQEQHRCSFGYKLNGCWWFTIIR